jgi:hypothetical protein
MNTECRITQPDSNQWLRIADLIARLETIKAQYGNLLCYIYSADQRASVPLLDLCLSPGRTLNIAAQIGTVCDEMYFDLLVEIERLRELAV